MRHLHVIGAGAELRYEHGPVRDGEAFDVGSLRFTGRDTPGHTPEHVAYAVADLGRGEDPALLFSGGSLLVGAVGRTDLLGEEHARDYAREMHRSLHDVVLAHEDHVVVHPTHGAGSLCATGIASTPTTTIGYERTSRRSRRACFAASRPCRATSPGCGRPTRRGRRSSADGSRSRGR